MVKKQEKKTNENKSNINWYPGHMEKARRDMQEKLKAVDMVIEIRDGRIPFASANPLLDQMIQNKPRLIVLSKIDLADEEVTKDVIQSLTKENQIAISLDLQNDRNIKNTILNEVRKLTEAKRNKMISRGIRPRAMRAMTCGVPNVGKSTLINRIAGKNRAVTADKPGVTRSLTWIHASNDLDLLDTPGVLWPKFENQTIGCMLAATGAINENILDLKDIALETILIIRKYYPSVLEESYSFEATIDKHDILKAIAKQRHLLKENEVLDEERAASLFLHEYRRGKLGRFTLERPSEEREEMSK